jgi:hypothetical protein
MKSEIQALNVAHGNLSGFEGLEAIRAPVAEERPLGVNEISGVALLYNVPSDQNEVFLPGAFSAFNGRKIIFAYEHKNPIGIAELREDTNGVHFRARIMGDKLVCSQLWRLWQSGHFRSLCLSSIPLAAQAGHGSKGEPLTVITRAKPRELSAVLGSGILGCSITGLGRLLEKESTWDHNLLRGNFLEQVQLYMAGTWLLWSQKQADNNQNRMEESYEQWLQAIEI